jgi:hypothetical protein
MMRQIHHLSCYYFADNEKTFWKSSLGDSKGGGVFIQEPQFFQISQCVWNGTIEIVLVKIQVQQVCQIPNITRNLSTW